MILPITMIDRSELFSIPPLGYLGVVHSKTPPEIKLDEVIEFQLFGEIIMKGVVVAIEPPGKNLRKSTKIDQYKIHWVPIRDEVPKTPAYQCPGCGVTRSSIYNTIKNGTTIQRYRRCNRCRKRWVTREVLEVILESPIKQPNANQIAKLKRRKK